MSRFSDIHPSKKVTQRKISFLMIYSTLGFVEERILPRIDDVILVIVNTYYSNWVHFQKLVQAKKLISIKFPFQRYIILLEQKKFANKCWRQQLRNLRDVSLLKNFMSSLHWPCEQSFVTICMITLFSWPNSPHY